LYKERSIGTLFLKIRRYGVEDGRHEPFLKMVSTPEARKKIEDFQLEVLKRKPIKIRRFADSE